MLKLVSTPPAPVPGPVFDPGQQAGTQERFERVLKTKGNAMKKFVFKSSTVSDELQRQEKLAASTQTKTKQS